MGNFQVEEIDKIQKKVKVVRKITPQRLKNIALFYLKRFESSTANLRTVLQRRVNDYARLDKSFDKAEAWEWIENLLVDFQRLGYLDDRRYCALKVKDYLAAGKSSRYIMGKMREKGIDANIVEQILSEQDFDPFDAALRLAQKKHLGPYRNASEEERKAMRSKDLASIVRAGFDYDVAVKVVDFSD